MKSKMIENKNLKTIFNEQKNQKWQENNKV